jgi:hypothetical protein
VFVNTIPVSESGAIWSKKLHHLKTQQDFIGFIFAKKQHKALSCRIFTHLAALFHLAMLQ